MPSESSHRGKYAPPDEPPGEVWWALLAVVFGIVVAVTGGILIGVGIAVVGLVWSAFMAGQQRTYEGELAKYNASTICLVKYHIF
ncbi:hypothetical protein [Streptomyces sp. NPDC088794]|uniref:hypothetical protein n=1 Tax=Streptomyces sp. NPDC088794 TaxID=3365902 RepID=UPI0037FE36F9